MPTALSGDAGTVGVCHGWDDKGGTLPLASVVVITRNRATSLTRTLQALQRLDYPDFEIVVVDNGSTDATAQVVSEFGARYVFAPPSSGFALCRQLGVEAARGEIIAMCDDDCIPVPEWLQHLATRLQGEADLGLVGGQVINVGFPEAQRYKGRSKLGRNGRLTFVADPREAEFFGDMNLAFRCSAIQVVGGYDPFLKGGLEEIDLAMSLRRDGFRVGYEPAAIVEHHHTETSYKKGRLFYGGQLMRLYFYLKHFCPRTVAAWLCFLGYELRLVGQDLIRVLRGMISATVRGRFQRWPGLLVELFNVVSARLAIPWLLWLLCARGAGQTEGPAQAA